MKAVGLRQLMIASILTLSAAMGGGIAYAVCDSTSAGCSRMGGRPNFGGGGGMDSAECTMAPRRLL